MRTKEAEIQPATCISIDQSTEEAILRRSKLTIDAIMRVSAASAPVLLMKFGRLFTFLVDRAQTTTVDSTTGRTAATTMFGWRSVSMVAGV